MHLREIHRNATLYTCTCIDLPVQILGHRHLLHDEATLLVEADVLLRAVEDDLVAAGRRRHLGQSVEQQLAESGAAGARMDHDVLDMTCWWTHNRILLAVGMPIDS